MCVSTYLIEFCSHPDCFFAMAGRYIDITENFEGLAQDLLQPL